MNSINPKKTIEKHFEIHNIKPTAVRILVWQTVSQQTETFTLNDAQALMPIYGQVKHISCIKAVCRASIIT